MTDERRIEVAVLNQTPPVTDRAVEEVQTLVSFFVDTRNRGEDFYQMVVPVLDPGVKAGCAIWPADGPRKRATQVFVAAQHVRTRYLPQEVIWIADTFVRTYPRDADPAEVERSQREGLLDDPQAVEAIALGYCRREDLLLPRDHEHFGAMWAYSIPYEMRDGLLHFLGGESESWGATRGLMSNALCSAVSPQASAMSALIPEMLSRQAMEAMHVWAIPEFRMGEAEGSDSSE